MSASALGPDTALLAVRLLGGIQIWREGQLLPRPLPNRKVASLFAFLLLHPETEFSRDFLAGTLWPDVDGDAALRSLGAALVPIRRFLEPVPEEKGRFLVSHRDTLQLLPPPGCWVDVWAFKSVFDAGIRASPGSPEWLSAREAAVALHGGELLPGYGDDWFAARREELRRQVIACLRDLTRADEERARLDRACEWARRALTADRCDEESHRSLMRLYAAQGEHTRAIQQYHECQRALREELDGAPGAETVALYRSLCRQRKARTARGSPLPAPRSPKEEVLIGREPGAGSREGARRAPGWGEASLDLDRMGPLVGREREQHRLQAAWERARAGRGELLLLTGEAGIGKSHLGRQLLQGVALDGGLALHGQATALESSFLYQPLIDPLRRALELATQHGLTLCAPVWLAQVARLLPEMRRGEESPVLSEGDGPGLLEQGVVQFLITLAAQRPLCLFLDDLHWADPATGRVLHSLAQQARQADLLSQPARMLLITSFRDEEVPESHWLGPWLTELQGQRMAAALPLARLSEEEVTSLLAQLAEGRASMTLLRRLGERLYQETEGNPFFLLQTLRDLFERSYLAVDPEGHWRLASEPLAPAETGAGPPDPARETPLARRLPLPASVQRVVRQRVGRLGVEERELLQCAAVIGRRFTFETVRRVVGQDVEPTLRFMERLLATGLIRAQAHPAALDFSHDKIREVVYEDLAPLRRQELHQRVGETLEAIYGPIDEEGRQEPPNPDWFRHLLPLPPRAEHAEELAHHFDEAAPRIGPEKAARYHCLAGMRARALMNYEKAVHDLLIALSLLAELSLDANRLALWGQIVQQLAPAYRGTGRVEAAREVLEEYLALCERHGYGAGIAHSCVLLGYLLELYPRPAGREESRAMYARAIAACEAHGLREWIAYPQAYLAHLLASDGADLERAEALARSCLPQVAAGQDQLVLQRASIALMWIASRRGDWEALKEVFQASLAAGGPFPLRLPELLEAIERRCHRTGDDATFVALCRELAEGYARAGLAPPLEQWYLAPASPRAAAGEPVIREEFDDPGWHPALIWVDATGLTRVDRATRPGWLGLSPPVGSDLWPETDLNAPRLVTPVRDDYIAQTRVELGEDSAYAGLLVWRDEQHFARLELRTRGGEETSVHLEACVAGRFRRIGRGRCERRPMWLRVERIGEEVRGLCSADGEEWLTCGSVRLPPGEREQVGLATITRDVGAHAWFDTFLLWRA